MLPETTKQRIEHDAQHRYSKHKEGLYKDNCVACYIAGATAEAERSAAWKAEATLLINKIHDWAEGDKTLPLGHSVFDEAVKRLKAYDELRVEYEHAKERLLRASQLVEALEWYADAGNYMADNGELATAWKLNDNIAKKAKVAIEFWLLRINKNKL